MREGWKTAKLKDCCTKIGSGATPRGGKEAYFDEGPFALIRSQNVLDFFFSYNGLAFIDKDQAAQLSNVEVKENDVLLNITGDSVARVCQVPSELLPARVNQHVSIIRVDQTKLIPEFLKYYLLNPKFKNHMLGLASVGGTRNALTKGMIEDFEIDLPPLGTQRRIATILSALDEKIELNRQTNQTLEALAQALFKEWFVDFNFSGATGEMQESELGPIPEGWRVGKLGDIAEINSGKGLKKDQLTDSGYPVLGANGCIGFTDNYLVNEELILTGRVGTLGTFQLVNGKVWISDNVLGIKSTIKELYYFIYFWIRTIDFRNLNRGSTQPLVTKTDLLNLVLVIPEIDLLKSFDSCCRPLFEQVIVNSDENHALAKTRDILLPKLLDGDIEV